MRNLLLRLYILWCWVVGTGPWLVIGQWVDDDGNIRRFRTGYTLADGDQWPNWDSKEEALLYADRRNEEASTDPLGTVYYVWHEQEYNLYQQKEKRNG